MSDSEAGSETDSENAPRLNIPWQAQLVRTVTGHFQMLSIFTSSEAVVLLEVILAMALGGVIGAEREFAQRPAGFRTHMLVAGASALLVGLSDALMTRFAGSGSSQISTDPIRIVEAIITGISFLGVGTIFRNQDKSTVHGLTTAASILFSASVGIAVSIQQFFLAIGATLLALFVLRGLSSFEKLLPANDEADQSDSTEG